MAVLADGSVRWRVAHSDVIAGAELTGGLLTLQTYGGEIVGLDPISGQGLA